MNSVTWTDDSTLYFTHTGEISMDRYHLELLSKQPSGKIYKHDMKTGRTEIFADQLHFPNGITYSKKDNCLYVNHLNKYEVIKFSLVAGTPKNSYSVVMANLPGFPDNLKVTEDNKLWVAIPSLRDPVTNMLDNYPLVRKMIINSRIPLWLFLSVANFSFSGAMKIDPTTGKVEEYFLGKSESIYFVTGALERGKKVYLTSLVNNFIAVFDL